MLEDDRRFSVPRQKVIDATPALQERRLAKHAALAHALATALEARGVAVLPAVLAARTGMAVFVDVIMAWLGDPKPGLDERLRLAAAEMKALQQG